MLISVKIQIIQTNGLPRFFKAISWYLATLQAIGWVWFISAFWDWNTWWPSVLQNNDPLACLVRVVILSSVLTVSESCLCPAKYILALTSPNCLSLINAFLHSFPINSSDVSEIIETDHWKLWCSNDSWASLHYQLQPPAGCSYLGVLSVSLAGGNKPVLSLTALLRFCSGQTDMRLC